MVYSDLSFKKWTLRISMFCINIEQLQSKASLTIMYDHMEFSLFVLNLILSRGNNFSYFLKIKQKISQMKQLFHNLKLRRKYDTNKHQRWGLIVKNFLGYNAVVSCPGETFFCIMYQENTILEHVCLYLSFLAYKLILFNKR